MDDYKRAYENLVLNDMEDQLPGVAVNQHDSLNENDIRSLVGYASLLSVSSDHLELSLAYEIITRLIEIKKSSNEGLLIASDLLLSRIGNFPGRSLLRSRYLNDMKLISPINFSLEKIARETENTIEREAGKNELLTDFQYSLYSAVIEGKSISVSAPTSAGKSFVLNLALQKRMLGGDKESIVYVVPTRALISEVTQRIRESLRGTNLSGVIIRTAPFPISKENVTKGVIYVLTQERLTSLLYSEEAGLWVTSLIVDEAHEIQKRKRGIVLQNSVDAVLSKFPAVPILFASPLISNPSYFIDLFNMGDAADSIIERLSPVAQNIILVEQVKRNTKKARFSLVGRDNTIELGLRNLDFKYRGPKTLIKSLLAIALTAEGDSTIIFANGPSDTENIAEKLWENLEVTAIDEDIEAFIEFIKTEIHSEYPLVTCLEKGVAFHYGYMPSIVRSGVEKLFKDGKIKYICCTSTLLQGVNLPAKNILIDNPKSGDRPMSRPDFLNLSGRAGRLLKEFHGNIWCINPDKWEDPIYKGEQLEDICSSIDLIMTDGGTIFDDLLGGRIKKEDEIESAEVAFSRIYHEMIDSGRDSIFERYGTVYNQGNLDTTLAHCENIKVTLPYSLLEAHKSLRPDHLENVYTELIGKKFLQKMAPIHPFTEGAKTQFESILTVISKSFEWNINEKYFPYLSFMAYQWVRGTSLGEIISNRVRYLRKTDPNKKVSSIIRGVLQIIEHDIRFKLEKYFSAYNDVLKFVFDEKNIDTKDYKIEPYHIYLEFGASDKTSLNLMALGLSRFTALSLKNYSIFKTIDGNQPEEYLRALSNLSLRGSGLPTVCLNEIHELVGE